jgi:hypothetical protein
VVAFEERVYELAVGALADQEREVGDIRARASTLIAAAAVTASLLARPVFGGAHPNGVAEVASVVVGVFGAAGALVFAVLLLRPNEIAFSLHAAAIYRALWEQQIVDQPLIDLALAETLEERRAENTLVVTTLVRYLRFGLAALVAETVGLATAAGLTL